MAGRRSPAAEPREFVLERVARRGSPAALPRASAEAAIGLDDRSNRSAVDLAREAEEGVAQAVGVAGRGFAGFLVTRCQRLICSSGAPAAGGR
jgi:hypothetical protein